MENRKNPSKASPQEKPRFGTVAVGAAVITGNQHTVRVGVDIDGWLCRYRLRRETPAAMGTDATIGISGYVYFTV